MAEIFQPPQIPPTFVGGRQPYAPPIRVTPSIDPPKPDADTDVNLRVVLDAWQPDAWPYAFVGGKQPYANPIKVIQPAFSIDDPPNSGLSIVSVIRDYQLPILPQKLNPALMGPPVVVVQQTPFSQYWLPAVLMAWQPSDPLPVQSRNHQIVSVDNPIPDADTEINLSAILSAWQPPDPWPIQRRPSQIVSVDNPPAYADDLADMYQIVQAWQPADPLPVQPRYTVIQPGAVVVTYVPFNQTWLSSVVATWQSPDPQPTQRRPSQIVSVDNPPGYRALFDTRSAIVAGAWQPPDPQPLQPLYRQIVSVDSPPFSHRAKLPIMQALLSTWQPPDPQPVQRGPLPAIILAVRVDNPPFTLYGSNNWVIDVLSSWQPPDPQPTQRAITLPIVGQSRDQPPVITNTRINMLGVINAWQPPDPFPTQPIYRQRSSVDNPPRYSTRAQVGAVQSWQPPDPFAIQPRYSVVQPGIVVVYVPFSQAWLVNVIGAWQPPDPIPLQRRTTFIPGMSVDNPPRITRAGIITGQIVSTWWQPPDPQPWQKPATIRVSVDQPRPRQMAWFATVLQAWQPPDPQPLTSLRHLPVRITAVPADNPPFGMRARVNRDILQTWQPTFVGYSSFTARARFIPMVRVSIIDNPSLRGTDAAPTLQAIDITGIAILGTKSDPDLEGIS